jgi:c-di-GMP-binding flagellar brake protein YcgR
MKDDFDNNQENGIDRKHHRTEIFVDVIYKVVSPIKGVGLSRNISHGGLCLLLDNELPPGTILQLKYRLPHEESRLIETTVEVIWQRKTEKGYITGVKYER